MSFQRINRSSPKNSDPSSRPSIFAPRTFSAPKVQREATPEELENQAFEQEKLEVQGLQMKEKQGQITSEESEKLIVLQAKTDSFLQKKMAEIKGQPNILEILRNNPQPAQKNQPLQPLQPKLTVAQPMGQTFLNRSSVHHEKIGQQLPKQEEQPKQIQRSTDFIQIIQRQDELTAHELTHVVQQKGILQCQTTMPSGGDPECPSLLEQIRRFIFGDEKTKGLIQRWDELRADPRSLQWDYWSTPHPEGYGSVEGHQRQFIDMQKGLRNRLNQWNSKNCDDPDNPSLLPENAWEWATRQAPVPIPQERPTPTNPRSVSVSDVIEVVLTLGLSIALVGVIVAALANPEPASKLALAGLSATMIVILLTRLGIESESGGTTT